MTLLQFLFTVAASLPFFNPPFVVEPKLFYALTMPIFLLIFMIQELLTQVTLQLRGNLKCQTIFLLETTSRLLQDNDS